MSWAVLDVECPNSWIGDVEIKASNLRVLFRTSILYVEHLMMAFPKPKHIVFELSPLINN
jgi:hypothetical protein